MLRGVDQDELPFARRRLGAVQQQHDPRRAGVVEQVVSIQGGYAFKSEDYIVEGIPLLKISNVSFGRIDWSDLSFLPIDYASRYSHFLLHMGDIVMAITRPVVAHGIKVAQLSSSDEPCLLNQRVCKFNMKDKIAPDYLYQTLFRPSFIQFVNDQAKGSQQPNISTNQLEKHLIPLPPLYEQRTIAATLRACDDTIAALEREAAAHDELFRALLEELMTGRIRATGVTEH